MPPGHLSSHEVKPVIPHTWVYNSTIDRGSILEAARTAIIGQLAGGNEVFTHGEQYSAIKKVKGWETEVEKIEKKLVGLSRAPCGQQEGNNKGMRRDPSPVLLESQVSPASGPIQRPPIRLN